MSLGGWLLQTKMICAIRAASDTRSVFAPSDSREGQSGEVAGSTRASGLSQPILELEVNEGDDVNTLRVERLSGPHSVEDIRTVCSLSLEVLDVILSARAQGEGPNSDR